MSILRKCASFISNFKSARSLLSTLLVRAAKALLRPSTLKLGGIGIKDCKDCRIFSDLSSNLQYMRSDLTPNCTDHHPIGIGDERERLVTASPVMTKSRAPTGGNKYPENGLVKPPKCDTRALSLAGMFGGKAPIRLAAQKRRPHAPSVSMRSAPAYFLCK